MLRRVTMAQIYLLFGESLVHVSPISILLVEKYLNIKLFLKKNEEDSIQPNNVDTRDFHLKVAKRSIRNCPWSSKLWINYALMLEKTNSTTEIIKSI